MRFSLATTLVSLILPLLASGSTAAQLSPPQLGSPCAREFIAVGWGHTLALKIDGSLWAYGSNYSGELGDGTTNNRVSPVRIGGTDWTDVAAGAGHSVGLRSDGSLWAWGNGQTSPQRIGLENDWAAISAGSEFTVALKLDRSLWAWGNNNYGQLGDGTTESRGEPIRIGTDSDWAAVDAGPINTVALKTDGSLWIWGGRDSNEVANTPASVGTDHDWARVSAGAFGSLALKRDGSLWAWGRFTNSPVRMDPGNDWASMGVGCGCNFFGGGGCGCLAFALKGDGSLWAAGFGGFSVGQLAGLWAGQLDPAQTAFARIDADYDWAVVILNPGSFSIFRNFVGLKTDGTLWSSERADLPPSRVNGDMDWGSPQSFPLSDEFRIVRHWLGSDSRFRAVVGPVSNDCYSILYRGPNVTNIHQPVAVGLNLNSCVNSMQLTDPNPASSNATAFYRVRQVPIAQPLDSDGDGIDDVYELRHRAALNPLNASDAAQDFDNDGRSNLQEFREGTNPATPRRRALAAGFNHVAALRTDGSLWAWGTNSFGEAGDGTTEPRSEPVRIGTDTDWVAVDAAGDYFGIGGITMALKTDGSLWMWGRGQTSPARIGGDNEWFAIAAGVQVNAVALRSDGSLWWVSFHGVTSIGADQDWIAIDAGARHVLALKSDGSLWACGENEYGQLGDGTLVSRAGPVRIGTDTDWTAIAAGGYQSMALKRNGSLWAWGGEWRPDESRPVRIGPDVDWTAISASGSDDPFDDTFAAVKPDGSLWFQTGSLSSNAPMRVAADTDWRTVVARPNGLVALKTDGSLWLMDWNEDSLRRIGTDNNWGSPP